LISGIAGARTAIAHLRRKKAKKYPLPLQRED
jgi:hypothetical protein